ncbi:MAG TPA: hypothetical protein VK151_17180 [Fluviicola sp.]|nr:hypothetical protein [Fluviicola sp.]
MKKVVAFVVLSCFLAGCRPGEIEKKQALKNLVEDNFVVKDTLIHYTLDTNRLVLEFATKTDYRYWISEAGLYTPDDGHEIYLGASDKQEVIDNKMVFTGFSLSEADLKNYKPWFFGFPYLENELVISEPFGNIRIMYRRRKNTENILVPDDFSRKMRYVKFNLDVFDTLSPELAAYCEQEVLKRFKISLKDNE